MKTKQMKTGKKSMKDYMKGKKNVNFWVDEGIYKEIMKLSQTIDVNSMSKMMRHILFEWVSGKKQQIKQDIYASLLTKMKDTYKDKDTPVKDRLEMILKLNKQIEEMKEMEWKEMEKER